MHDESAWCMIDGQMDGHITSLNEFITYLWDVLSCIR